MRGREVLRETREEVAKSGDVLRESRLVFFAWSGGGGETISLACLCLVFSVMPLCVSSFSFCFSMMSFYFSFLAFLFRRTLSPF